MNYSCRDCLGFCCSVYDSVPLSLRDIKRLTKHLRLKIKAFVRLYTRGGVKLQRKPDHVLGETCIFFDTIKRCCSVYEARPQICREWPRPEHQSPGAEARCCYFDVYQFTRRELAADVVPLVQIGRLARSGTLLRSSITGEKAA